MALIAKVKTHFWDKFRFYPLQNIKNLQKGDIIIVKTEHGLEKAEVFNIQESAKEIEFEKNKIVRKASNEDLKVIARFESKKEETLKKAKKRVGESKMPIKIIDASFTFCGSKVIFAFISEERIDFRELVKRLSRDFQKGVRMQQVGSRDEAREKGGVGICGRSLCCISFLQNMESITTDMARTQQIIKQGSQRITGVCGRLMCCLAFEEEQYREMAKNMPEIGEKVKTKEGSGIVVNRNILKQTVMVEVQKDKDRIKIEIPVAEL